MGNLCSQDTRSPENTGVGGDGKPLHEWSADDVRATLKVFKDFDRDNSGFIDAKELKSLCDVLSIEGKVAEADTLTKDGKIDPKEFFAWYVGCTAQEANSIFSRHAIEFEALRGKELHEWSAEEVKATLQVFRDFDKDNSGAIDSKELKELCAVLCIEANFSEADTLTKDGKVDPKEFFAWYVGCNPEEAAAVFSTHGAIFAGLSGKQFKEWSAKEVQATLKVFQDFDRDSSGAIDAKELKALCEVLCIEAKVAEADTLKKDGKIDPQEFFSWYVGCTAAEAAATFEKHKSIFR